MTIPASIVLAILLALGCVFLETRRRKSRPRVVPIIGLVLGIAVLWPLHTAGGTWAVVAGFALGIGIIGFRGRWLKVIPSTVVDWTKNLIVKHQESAESHGEIKGGTVVKKSLVGAFMFIALLALFTVGVQLLLLLMNPL